MYDISGTSRTIKNGGGMGAKTGLYKVHNTQTRNISDTQRYKQLGNAVSVPVIKAVAERLM